MNVLVRLATYSATAFSLTAALAFASWAWPAGPDQDLLALPGLLSELGEARCLGDELDRRQGRIGPRHEEREAVTGALVEGQLSLAEAASRFRALNEADPEAAGFARRAYPEASSAEASVRQSLAWARARLAASPPEVRDEVMGRLEREAEELHGGTRSAGLDP